MAPASGWAADPRQPLAGTATISKCRGDSLTIAAQLRRSGRRVRRSKLRLQFEAAPLFGRGVVAREVAAGSGRARRVRRFEAFTGLRAQAYRGIVHYRFVRRGRTIRSGRVLTTRGRAAGKRGRATCSLTRGKPPQDRAAPYVASYPADDRWRAAPLDVHVHAVDALSGVAAVFWRLDGGPITQGRHLRIDSEGPHRVDYFARDVAGNGTSLQSVILRVDAHPPTAAAITSPAERTVDPTPIIRWKAAFDSGSGVQMYWAVVRDSSGAIVFAKGVPAAELAAEVTEPLAPASYTAEVVAVDGTTPEGRTSSAKIAFSVIAQSGSRPNDGGSTGLADRDGDGVGDSSDNCPNEPNADQLNTDGVRDGGDACDADDDNDSVNDLGLSGLALDNCRTTPNPDQEDFDSDGFGDACENSDSDSHLDAADNCKAVANENQADVDSDGQGDVCDDSDSDGVVDAEDNCRTAANGSQRDSDRDAIGNQCDNDADGDGTANGVDPDDDADTVPDTADACPLDPPAPGAPAGSDCPSPMP